MNKQIRLSDEEMKLLRSLSNEQLRMFRELREQPVFLALHDLVNAMIDYEKEYVFSLNEGGMSPTDFVLKHAFSRGQAAIGPRILRLITGSGIELLRREKEREKEKKKIVSQT